MHGTVLLAAGLGSLFAALVVGVTVVATNSQQRHQIERSLAAITRYRGAAGAGVRAHVTPSARDRLLRPTLHALTRLGRRMSPAGSIDRINRRLDLAGNPAGWDVERVFAWKSIAAAVCALVFIAFGLRSAATIVVFGGIGLAAGFFLPDLLLYNAGEKRQANIQKQLPDALDLLVISVEAGLGFDAALLNVTQKMPDGPLVGEFARVLQEMQIGSNRVDTLRALGERTTVTELQSFVGSLVQADKLGIPIANVLREQAAEMRVKRRQRAEEKAQKVPVKILFPLIICIMPALFIVVLGPAVISILRTLSGN
jgi:tight adherence protein C